MTQEEKIRHDEISILEERRYCLLSGPRTPEQEAELEEIEEKLNDYDLK